MIYDFCIFIRIFGSINRRCGFRVDRASGSSLCLLGFRVKEFPMFSLFVCVC